jgi:hypothetical protein
MEGIEHARELLSEPQGEGVVKNKDIMEMALGIALEFFDYPVFPGENQTDFLAKQNLIAYGIKLLLKNSKIPCEKKGLFTEGDMK